LALATNAFWVSFRPLAAYPKAPMGGLRKVVDVTL